MYSGIEDLALAIDCVLVGFAQVLSRMNKANCLLLGEPGVGKTAVVEALAQRVVDVGEEARKTSESRESDSWLAILLAFKCRG